MSRRCVHTILNMILASMLLASNLTTANAEESDEYFQPFLLEIQEEIFPLVMANRPPVERERAQGVKVKIVTDFFARNVAMANSDTKEIIISSGFLWGIWAYSQAFMVESYTDTRYFREWYFHYLLWRHPAFWDGSMPLGPAEFFGLNESDSNKALNNPSLPAHAIFNLAIFEVLMHELGHIALDATYDANSSSAYKLQKEIQADNWAREAARSLNDASGIGRLVALGYLNELERFYGFNNNIYATHPTAQERFEYYLDHWCASQHLLAHNVCKLYKNEYEFTFSADNQLEEYDRRAEMGEAHAAIKLGDFYLEGKIVNKNVPKACEYFKEAYIIGDRNVGALNYGWCMVKGYFGSESKEEGVILLEILEDKGWSYARRILDGI